MIDSQSRKRKLHYFNLRITIPIFTNYLKKKML